MEKILYLLIFAMLVFICVKNFSLLKRYKFNKKYIECYKQVLKDEENVYEYVSEYISSQKKEEYINKARVLKLYVELKNDIDYTETLELLDIRKIFYNDKDKYDNNLVIYNSDTFVFLMMAMSKAYAKLKPNVVTSLYEKMQPLTELSEQVEYQEVIAFYNALLCKDDYGSEVMNCLLNGEYTKYKYDKNMIGIYKRIAAATLLYIDKPISDYDQEDLGTFAKSLIGKQILNDLKIYDKCVKSIEEVDKQ